MIFYVVDVKRCTCMGSCITCAGVWSASIKSLALCVILSHATSSQIILLITKKKTFLGSCVLCLLFKNANHSDYALCEHPGISKLLPDFY
jgi:hypothetical protein